MRVSFCSSSGCVLFVCLPSHRRVLQLNRDCVVSKTDVSARQMLLRILWPVAASASVLRVIRIRTNVAFLPLVAALQRTFVLTYFIKVFDINWNSCWIIDWVPLLCILETYCLKLAECSGINLIVSLSAVIRKHDRRCWSMRSTYVKWVLLICWGNNYSGNFDSCHVFSFAPYSASCQ